MYLFSLILISQFTLSYSSVGYFIGTDNTGQLTAGDVCNNAGGRLAIIDSRTAFNEASSVASNSGYGWVVVALHCTSRDTSCSDSASKWTWYDSQNNNYDICDLSVGGMDDLSLYQTWDQWNKIPDENEYCVEFYGGKLVLEYCSFSGGIIINSGTSLPNAALCQPLEYISNTNCAIEQDIAYYIATDTSGTLTAGQVCNNTGGRLAIITNSDDFNEASSVTLSSGYYWVIVALHCTSRDTSCADSPSKWTWYDSQNNNNDICDISTGSLDTLSYYQTWDQWNKIPSDGEHCVEFYGGKLVLEVCNNPNVDEIMIVEANAALCQPLARSISACTNSDDTNILSSTIVAVIIAVCCVAVFSILVFCLCKCYNKKEIKDVSKDEKKSSFIAEQNPTVVIPQQTQQKQQPQIVVVQNTHIQQQQYESVPMDTQVTPPGTTDTGESVDTEIKDWIENIVGLPQYLNNFLSNGYDKFEFIKDISDKNDLEEIGITLKGHQQRILKQILLLKNNENKEECNQQNDNNYKQKDEPKQETVSWEFKVLTNWSNNDVLQWIYSMTLSEKWMETVTKGIENSKCNGNDLSKMKNKNDVSELFCIDNPMLAARIWKQLKDIKERQKQQQSNSYDAKRDQTQKIQKPKHESKPQSQTNVYSNSNSNANNKQYVKKGLKCDKGYPMYLFVSDKEYNRLWFTCKDCKRSFNKVMAMYSCQIKAVYDKYGNLISKKSQCSHSIFDYSLCTDCGEKRKN